MSHVRGAVWAALSLTVVAAACGKSPPPPVTPEPVAQAPESGPDEDAERRAREAREREEREAAEARRRAEEERATLEARVFFDYDEATIREDAKRTLDAKLPILRRDMGLRILVEGHADERGSTEYNLALGASRAQSIVEYLVSYGVERDRFRTVSYGEERPLAGGTGEASWSQNRRGEFVVTSGAGPVADGSGAR